MTKTRSIFEIILAIIGMTVLSLGLGLALEPNNEMWAFIGGFAIGFTTIIILGPRWLDVWLD